ncbi:Ig-like domain-containing protein [Plebeiibacterium sediminum]|uniref:Ig-like domain-containing protein n=1 Tax=Plebeiibacterium sediminum TaxID=2992112 RepID=A0AAE3M368_9BACT|nr:Ig-like domain-containing protein [Plebeiobacterium sediminum]MCW3785920.1 Ig-like domain-containing protein [Plebeiobacterium sediminum]
MSVGAVVSDGLLSSAPSTITVTVSSVNDAPISVEDAISLSEGGSTTSLNGGGSSVLENDNDIDGNTLTAVLKSNVSNGTLTLNSDGTFSYTHDDSETTSDSFSYAANDGTVDGNTVIVTINISAINDNSPVLTVENTIVEENHAGTVLTATSTDGDLGDSKLFSLSGDDYALFTIGETSGVLSFLNSPDYENPTDNGGDNVYDLTILVRDAVGHETSEDITITVTDVNDNSPILSVANTIVEENHTGVVLTATSTDADAGDSETYSISGTDASLFVIDPGSGELIFKNSPDYENPTDNGGNNIYDLNIIVTDAADHTDSESVTITVSAVNDNLPVISVGSTTIYENHTGVVLTATSTDADAGDSKTYSISGTDYAAFDINSTNGELTFKSAPDFENPTDANQNNIYELTVTVTDGADHTDSESITITVQNIEETANFSIDAISPAYVNENEVYTSVTPHITGSPIGDVVYTLGGTDASAFSINPSSGVVSMEVRDYENPADSNGDNVYSIRITATDEDNNFVSASWSVTVLPVNEFTPVINVGNVTLSENHTGTVTVASATDQDDDDTESYSITGTDSELFAMNSSNGILTFINAPDFENPSDNDNNNIYELTVVVTDGAGHSDSELITITISNLNDNTPIANADAITVNEGGTSTTLSGGNDSVLDNDSDADGDALTAVLMSNVSYGTLTLHPNGTFNYTHDGSENHSDSFTYAANDGSSNGNTVSVSISVTPVNDDPVITDIPDQTRAEDVNFGTISLDSYIDDIETSDEDIIWSVNPVPTFFDIVITNRVASITPKDAEWNGVEVITFYATDEGNTSVYDNVRLEVTAVNDEPIITGQNSISIAEETLTEISLSDLIVEDPDNNYPTNYIMTILPGANYIVNGTAITPNENVTGTITVQVYVVDPAGAQSNTYNLQVNVINDNDPPVVIDIPNQTIAEGATFSDINLNLYVSDPDNTNDQISWSYSGNSDLVIAIDETTKIASVEIPNEDWFGQETIRFTASDGTLSNSNDVVLTVTPVNDAPIINSQQSLTYNEDVVFTIPFTALNVTDIDNTYSSQHEMTLLAGSNYTFSGRQVTPLQDFNGTLTIPLYVSDLGPVNQNSITFNLSVTINPVNDAPVIESQINTISTNEDVPVAISLDDISIIDVDNESTDFSLIVHAGENYTFDGTTITPVLNYYGTLSVDVSVSDGESTNSESSIFTVDVLVLAQNDTPIANSQNVTIAENQQITVNINNLISDVEDGIDLSTLKILSDVTNGTTSIDLQNAIITYVPNNGYSGTDSFTYEICDNEGACASGVISILVSNEAPTGVNDIVDVDEDNSISINVTSNDTDPQDNIDASTLTLLSLPTNGEATIQTGGIVVYTPNSNYFGEDTFEYQVCDEDGYCTTANVFITVNAVNDQPVIVSQNSIEIQEEGTYTVTLNNISVSDVDNNYPSDFILSVLSGNNYTVVGNTITPALNFNGELLVNVIVNDQEQNNNISDVYSLVISVIGVNDRPEITDQLTLFTNEDEPLPVTLTDLIVEDPDNNYPNDFVLVVLAGLNYSVSNNVITPVSNYSGFLNVPVYVSDQSEENNRSRIFNLVVEVVSQNDAPVTQNVNYSTSENVSVEIAFADLVTDVDGNIDYSTFENISTPSNGTIQIDRVNFIVTYTPEQGFSGDDEFNFRFSDAEGLVSNISTVYINVNNEAPNAINDNVEVNEDESIVISVLDNDTDPQDNIDISSLIIINNPVNGVLSLNSSTAEITYTPNENYFGTDNFRYRVFDDLGYSDDATVSISILAVNDLPVAVGDEAETNEDESVIIDVLSNDYDIDSESDGFVVTITLQAENGTAEVNASNQIIYTPNADFNGADTFEYQVCDSENGCNNAQVILQVLPQNDAPVAYDDEITSAQDTEVTINVISNDVDIDDNLDITSLSLLSQPTNGVCTVESLTGEITYVPNEGFSGTDSFIYQICDDEGLCSSATVTVNVSLQNVAPVCEDDVIYMVDGETVTFNVLDNDTDINGDEITVLVDESELLGGFLRVQENGVFTYTSIYGEYCIEEYFTYVGCDDSGNCDEATVKFIIGVADSDEDGIADYIEEQNFNTDGDEFPDYRDTDSDNDGILDVIEGGVSETCLQDVKDTDEDGIPDYRDEDSDDDGVLDSEEGAEDCDNDGILNFQDSFDDCAERIDAPDTFSPNGDGVNDYFMIPGVSDYEGNEIFIYNRWGGEVFHMRNYDNKWDGKSSNSAIGSAELPQGLYFYVVKLGGSNGVIKGSVYIKR